MLINRSLKKHGNSNFSFTILEYCEVSDLLIREKHYWDIFKLEYNTAQDPTAPFVGRKHSDKTKTIMSDAKKGITGKNHPRFGQNHTDESKKIMSDAKKGQSRPLGSGKASQSIEVFDLKDNITTTYNSISEAAKALNINHASIVMYFKQNQKKPYKGRYTFK
jgi:group I intron endonuclease